MARQFRDVPMRVVLVTWREPSDFDVAALYADEADGEAARERAVAQSMRHTIGLVFGETDAALCLTQTWDTPVWALADGYVAIERAWVVEVRELLTWTAQRPVD